MATNPQYIKYQDYYIVKKSFVYTPTDEFNISFVNALIKDIRNTPTKEKLLYKTFYELKKFISRNHSFLEYGKEKCCNYINYWLNKTVRDSEYGVNKEKFKFFDEFMQRDPKASDGPFNCISKLSYMDTDSFQKMKKLYDLYDYFTELKEHEDSSTLCRSISDLAKKYESMMREYEKDNKLCNMLTNLRGVIERDKLVAKDICEKNTFDSFILKIDPPREEQKELLYHKHMVDPLEKHIPDPSLQLLHHVYMIETLYKHLPQLLFQFLYHKQKDWKNQRGERVNEHYQYPKNNLHDHYHYYYHYHH
ncbi:hypothetical protein PVBG_06077 [Plasmodium vivax Brazil I]|uniref:Uncharacterized protein n=1 Tax=Plasmodium vivax (strain Brazil I) TaxID=1033975 RepID=A0A0J9T0I4_PLAV1|nr:hypothetical protein PVBG_06077 [Plasmodium vivax Brazil I]